MNLSEDKTYSLLPVLRYALWGEATEALKQISWTELMQLAQEQAVFGLAFRTFEQLPPKGLDQKWIFEYIGLVGQIERSNHYVNRTLKDFFALLEKHSVPFGIVKGQVVGTCYPKPLLRQSGDVDFWVQKEHIAKCEDFVNRNLGLTILRNESEKHVEFQWHGIQFEMHSHLATFVVKKNQIYFDGLVENDIPLFVKVGDAEVPTLSPTLNALYIFIHLFHHLIHMGVGLRQFCDWMMWLHQYKDVIKRDELSMHLQQLGLKRPYRVLGAILVDNLGLPEEEFPVTITEKDRKRSRHVLKDIMKMGNFGHNMDKIKRLGLLHSLQTGFRMCVQSIKYIDLAPQEIACRIPHTILWYLRK